MTKTSRTSRQTGLNSFSIGRPASWTNHHPSMKSARSALAARSGPTTWRRPSTAAAAALAEGLRVEEAVEDVRAAAIAHRAAFAIDRPFSPRNPTHPHRYPQGSTA